MHSRAYDYVKRVVLDMDDDGFDFSGASVVEFGAYNVNGSVRDLFLETDYTGVDVRAGKGVDVRADAAEWGEDGAYDVVVSTEMLEHAEDAEAIVANAYRVLADDGTFIVTAAGPERDPHGNDGGHVGDEFYRNVTPEDLAEWLDAAGFSAYDVNVTADGEDIRATAIKDESE